MKTLYLICCSMRSGSTLLEFLLKDAGIGNAREYLHGNQPAFDTYKEYARRIYNGNYRRNIIGWRVMWGQFWIQQEKKPAVWLDVPVETMLDGVIEAVGADTVKYIYLVRQDYLRQAVSAVRADTNGRWYCPSNETEHEVAIPFNAETIERVQYLIAELPKYNAMWETYFAERQIAPLRLVYEDLTATDDCIKVAFWQMVDYIGADVPTNYEVTIPLKKQAGQDVERWIEQFQRNGHDR